MPGASGPSRPSRRQVLERADWLAEDVNAELGLAQAAQASLGGYRGQGIAMGAARNRKASDPVEEEEPWEADLSQAKELLAAMESISERSKG